MIATRRIPAPGRLLALALLPALGGCDLLSGPDEEAASIEIITSRSTVDVLGDTVQLTAAVKNEGGSTIPGAPVEWASRSSDVAAVDADGVLTAGQNGSTWVVATSGAAMDSLEFTVAAPVPCPVHGVVEVEEAVQGALSGTDCRVDEHFADIWQLELSTERQVTIDLVSQEFDAYLVLLHENGSVLVVDDDGGQGLNSRITTELTAGSYRVVATSFAVGETGDYELSVIEGVPPPPCSARADVALPDTVSSAITVGACDFTGFLLDIWRLEVPVDTVVRVQVDSEAFDPGVAIADTLGQFLSTSDMGPGNSAWIEVSLTAGSYDVWLGAAEETGVTGEYTLSVTHGPVATLCPVTGPLEPAGAAEGEITEDDCFFWAGVGDAWRLDLAETTHLELTVETGEFRPLLGVFNERGELMAEVQPAGSGSPTILEVDLDPGSYRAWVVALEEGLGTYTLTTVTTAAAGARDDWPTSTSAGKRLATPDDDTRLLHPSASSFGWVHVSARSRKSSRSAIGVPRIGIYPW